MRLVSKGTVSLGKRRDKMAHRPKVLGMYGSVWERVGEQ